jgi:hypothetical protein
MDEEASQLPSLATNTDKIEFAKRFEKKILE